MKKKWYQIIIDKIKKSKVDVVFIEDKDNLFKLSILEEKLKKYYPTIHFYQSELSLRKILSINKEKTIVIFNTQDNIPYDLAQNYYIIKISLEDIFPLLEVSALDWLSEQEIQKIYKRYCNKDIFNELSKKETLNFIINAVYGFMITTGDLEDIITFLIKYYLKKDNLEGEIKNFIKEKANSIAIDKNKILSKDSFYNFLQKEWEKFIVAKSRINFKDERLKYLLDDCFKQNLLEAVDLNNKDINYEQIIKKSQKDYWIKSGIKNLEKISVEKELHFKKEKLKGLLEKELSTNEWGSVAKIWGNISYLTYAEEIEFELEALQQELDNRFLEFIIEDYKDLVFAQSFENAPLNNRILPYINNKTSDKFALLCFDCMSFRDWQLIKSYLNQELEINYKENFTLAMIPTVTSYSRQAIFSAKLPIEDGRVYKEKKAFMQYLTQNMGIKKEEIYFNNTELPETINLLGYKAVGLIYRFIDESVHNAKDLTMHLESLEHFLKRSELKEIIEILLQNNFRIYFTSDHGNCFCQGNGVNLGRNVVEEKTDRAALYRHKSLANEIEISNKLILQLPNILGDDYILTNTDRSMFNNKEAKITHGGVSIEEVIIPFIEVIKK